MRRGPGNPSSVAARSAPPTCEPWNTGAAFGRLIQLQRGLCPRPKESTANGLKRAMPATQIRRTPCGATVVARHGVTRFFSFLRGS